MSRLPYTTDDRLAALLAVVEAQGKEPTRLRRNARPPFAVRFWSHVVVSRADECWPFVGTMRKGYGRLSDENGKIKSSHRLAWTLVYGDPGPLCVLHHCDNRRCCNPGHLFLGTYADNNADRHAKGRTNAPRGEQSGTAKLTESDVLKIRRLAGGASQAEIARQLGVDRKNVWCIVHGKSWKHLGAAR